ncbi:MAG: DUF1254 domain-containing protein [Planctomycetes bacterium]|nr:DUF1254 domain-containing protein [Planctomycetota bacterium]
MHLRYSAPLVHGALTLLSLTGCASHDALEDPTVPQEIPTLEETRRIAEEALVYGLPLVMNYGVMHAYIVDRESGQWKAPFNTLFHEHRVYTYEDTAVVTPNSDTPYSMAWLDLRAEPMVISVPAVEPSRYYSVQMIDGNTFNYGYVGSRATGNEAGSYLVAGPSWSGEAPAGIRKVFRSTTEFSPLVFRTQLFRADDMPNVERVQAGYALQPLSKFLGSAPPAPAPEIAWPKIDKQRAETHFLEYLDFVLAFAPPGPEERAIRADLARIGVGPGKVRRTSELSPAHLVALGEGLKAGQAQVKEKLQNLGTPVNGWRIGSAFGDRAFFAGNWLLRAVAAEAGIYGNNAEEAVYPMAKTLPDGTPLDGAKHAYELRFEKGQLPPVNAFWSITMYDGRTQLLVKNPIGRYLINAPMLPQMKTDADGGLTIHIQKDSPGAERESNWLPAPDGPIYLVMRLYWPKTEAPSILPPGQGSWKPPALRLAR